MNADYSAGGMLVSHKDTESTKELDTNEHKRTQKIFRRRNMGLPRMALMPRMN